MKYKVLIIDDNINNSRLIEGILLADNNEYECLFAKDGEEGHIKAIQELPDLILLDIMMPKVNGIECLKRIRQNDDLTDTPVIMITAHKTSEVFTESFEMGAFDFITKPIDVNELRSRVHKALGITESLRRIKRVITKYEKERIRLQRRALATQNANNSFILFNRIGEIDWANEGFKRLHGISILEHIRRNGNYLQNLSKNEEVRVLLSTCIDCKTPVNYIDRITEEEREVEWVQVFVTPQLNDEGEITQIVAIETDISELKKNEEKLHKQNQQMIEITENLETAYERLEKQKSEIEQQKFLIEEEQEKSEKLLLNILPFEVARQLKSKGRAGTRNYRHVSVLFTDFKGFSRLIRGLDPKDLVSILDMYFARFDEIIGSHYLEKIKTIGDSYMCAGGLPLRNKSNPVDAVLAGLEIQDFMNELNDKKVIDKLPVWELRLGIHTGSVVAGVVGKKKFAYDIWGDTVNVAARMEDNGQVGMVNISGSTYDFVKDYFECTYRGKIEAKNIGKVDMYFVHRIKPELSADEKGFIPNEDFQLLINKL